MELYAITVYVISSEILKMLKIDDDVQAHMSNAEVVTFTVIASRYFSSNFKMARYMCGKLHLFPNMLSNSRLNRRIHQIPWVCWNAIFRFLALIFKQEHQDGSFAVDSFPIASCQKNRIDKRRIFIQRQYLGYSASKKRYFCGIKVHMIVTGDGKPVEMHFRPGSEIDGNVLCEMELDIPPGSKLYADGAYNYFDLEDILREEHILLLAKRGKAAKNRLRTAAAEKEISSRRQIVETVFSCIANLLPRTIKVRTEACFLIKIFCSVLAYSIGLISKDLLV